MKTVFISGAANGLGAATVDHFVQHGFRVIAADLIFKETIDFRPGKELVQIPLDVSDSLDVEKRAEELKKMGIRIDHLVNNAGFFDVYPLTEHDPVQIEKIIDVNTLGPVRLIRAFLHDLLRARGRVVQISSESVKVPGLFQPYQVSKIALEAFSKSIRQELALKGVKLIIIRPGAMRTQLYGKLKDYKNPVADSFYEKEFETFVKSTRRFIGRVIEPDRTARLIYKVITTKRPKHLYRINNNPVVTLISTLPDRLMDRFVTMIVRKGTGEGES